MYLFVILQCLTLLIGVSPCFSPLLVQTLPPATPRSLQKKISQSPDAAKAVTLGKRMAALEQELSTLKRQLAALQAQVAAIQVDGRIARNAEEDNAVLEVALEQAFGAEKGKRVISRENFPTFVPHNPHIVMGDLARIQQEYVKAGLDVLDYPAAYYEAQQHAFPGTSSYANADLPHYRLDGTALITLHWSLGYHPRSADFEMKKQDNVWKITKYSSSVMW